MFRMKKAIHLKLVEIQQLEIQQRHASYNGSTVGQLALAKNTNCHTTVVEILCGHF